MSSAQQQFKNVREFQRETLERILAKREARKSDTPAAQSDSRLINVTVREKHSPDESWSGPWKK
jgi:hypothetical protein